MSSTTAISNVVSHPLPHQQSETTPRTEPPNTLPRSSTEPFETIPDSPHDAAEDESQYPKGPTRFLIVASVTLVYILTSLDSSIVSVVVPSLTDEFHTLRDVGWYSSSYRLCVCAFQFMFGKLYKVFLPKRIFLAGVGVFIMGSVVCATARSSAMFIVGRAVCGVAASATMAGGLTLLVLCVPMRKRPLYTGIVGGVAGVSGVASPMLGGAIVDGLGWRWCFWISLPLGFVTMIVLFFCLPDNTKVQDDMTWRQRLSQLDLFGTGLFVAALSCLFVALNWAGSKYAWNAPIIIGLLVGSGILLALFGVDQYWKGEAATLPPRILCNRSVLSGLTYTLFCNAATMVVFYYLPTYYQAVRGKTAAQSGYYQIPAIAGDIIGVVLQSTGVTIVGYYTPFMYIGTLLMPILAGLLTTIRTRTSLIDVLILTGFFGFSGGIGFLSPQSAVQMALSKKDASIGLSIILFAEQFGAALFISAAQNIFQNRLTDNLHTFVPALNATSIESVGLTELRSLVAPGDVGNVLDAVDKSVAQTWYLAVGLSCLTFLGSATMEWKSVKEKKS